MKHTFNYKNAFRILKGGKISLVVSALLAGTTIVSASPTGGNVTSGTATISQSGTTTTINQSTNKASINWQSFSIAPSETVNFIQPSSTSVTLNRVVGTTNSLISGAMNANGQVILVNPNGVVFSEGATVNVGGLIATTKNITDANFQNGNYIFEGDSTASILNLGTINAKYVAMMGKEVANEGSIVATLGRVELAGGDKFTLNLNGDSLLSLRIDEGTLNALVENKGLIKADGGVVYLTTQALDSILDGMVNNTGVIEAQSLSANENGEIVLFAHGGTANIGGTIKAEGGFVETSGAKVDLKDDLKIKTKNWLIDPYDIEIVSDSVTETSITPSGGTYTAPSDSTKIKASTLVTALNAGTDVTVTTAGGGSQNGDITVNSAISWTSDKDLTLHADRNININADITATDSAAKLTLEYGQTTANSDYNIAHNVKINLADGQNFSTKNGSDTVVDYTVINSAAALQAMNSNLSGNFALGSDVDLTGITWTPIGTDYSTNPFTGKFTGLGHTVDNLTINNPTANNQALFGATSGSLIRDMSIENINITANLKIGALVGEASNTVIKNVHSSGNINANVYAGGLLGGLDYGVSSLMDSSSSVDVVVNGYAGGLIGFVEGTDSDNKVKIKNSFATGDISGSAGLGGLVGWSYMGDYSTSYASGTITGDNSSFYVGGFAGFFDEGNSVSDAYAIGNVTGDDNVGGFLGVIYGGSTLTNVWASGVVTGNTMVGGVVGKDDSSIGANFVTTSYWDTTTTGQQYAIGSGTDTTGAIANAVAYTQTSYTNFDFTNDWFMVDGYTRPFLRMEWTPVISNAHQLQMMSSKLGSSNAISYTLANDIDLAPSLTNKSEMWKDTSFPVNYLSYQGSFVPIGEEYNYFYGHFDGTNKTISNLYINRPNTDEVALFGAVQGSTISNLGLENVDISGGYYVGGLIGYMHGGDDNYGGDVSNVYVTGDVTGDYAGGLVGYAEFASISDSYATGSVTGEEILGGLVGYLYEDSSVTNSWAGVDVFGEYEISGGLVGQADSGVTISNSYATGRVENIKSVGGLVAYIDGDVHIDNSYATGDIYGEEELGGLVASSSDSGSQIVDSYATGNVYITGSETDQLRAGGLAGDFDGLIERSYATGNVFAGEDSQGTLSFSAFGNTYINYQDMGGLVGLLYTNGRIKESYATGNVSGTGNGLGGLVGRTENAILIENSYATGSVTSTRTDTSDVEGVGGLIGAIEVNNGSPTTVKNNYSISDVTVTNSQKGVGGFIGIIETTDVSLENNFWDSELSGLSNAYYDAMASTPSYVSSAIGEVEGKTTAEMKLLPIFDTADWDIVTDSSLSNVYPQLRWATSGLSTGESVWVIAGTSSSNSENSTQTTPSQTENTIKDIVTNIVNSSTINSVKPTEQNVQPTIEQPTQNPTDGFARRVESTIVNKTPDITNDKGLGTLAFGLDSVIRTVAPKTNEVSKDTKLTVVGETGGEGEIAIVELADLMAKSGGGELRVALSPDSFVELVNGGVNLPDGVSQEFYVVEDKK